MNNLKIQNNQELLEGFNAVCSAVAETLGAEGKYAIMENSDPYGQPIVTKDGISVARQIFFPNKFHNIGAFLAKQVAAKTLAKAGDNTTTSLVLAKALVNIPTHYNKAVERGFKFANDEVLKHLDALSKPVDTHSLQRIATISANNDETIGKTIIDAYNAVGFDAIIEVKENIDNSSTFFEVFSGMKVDSGWATPWFINRDKTASWENENVLVLCASTYESDEKIKSFIEANKNRPILLIMERFSEVFKEELEGLFRRGVINICLVQAPDFDVKRLAYMEDIALYTDGEVYAKGQSIVAGIADKVIVDESTTAIIKNTVSEAVLNKIESLKAQTESITDKNFLKKRIQKLEGISCVIKVGGVTETEAKERFDRVEDAVFAVKSSLVDGWIAGGGSALVYISNQMNSTFENRDEQLGYNFFREAIQMPFKQIILNANRQEKTEEFVTPTLQTYGVGYNAKTDRVSNLIEDGVLDSTRSLKVALENARSVAERLLNVGVIVTYHN